MMHRNSEVYRHFATLYFCFIVDEGESELGILDLIQVLVSGTAMLRRAGKLLQGSFSALSKPIFASGYSFESYRRDLHNTLLCTPLQSQLFL